ALADNIVLNFDSNVQAGSGNFVISDGAGDTRTIAVTDATQVTISGNSVTLNPSADLAAGVNYNVTYAAGVLSDAAGNGITAQADPLAHNFDTLAFAGNSSVVVFDLVNGVSSNHSGRTFDPNVAYTIQVIIDPTAVALNINPAAGLTASYGTWSGGGSLGADDTLNFISGVNGATGANVIGFVSNVGTVAQPVNQVSSYPSLLAAWTSSQLALYADNNGTVGRFMSGQIQFANVWTGSWSTLGAGRDPGNTMIPLPAGLLTSQGLV
ncbi:MAG: Ig-like domain-containing protein, partial [Gammaproteobacteria bacterium]|nr:Ig-like domain-containing protein [Gammaproteobacteria bacterium]